MTTIADIHRKRIWLEVRCDSCGRIVCIPWRLIPYRVPRDLPADEVAPFFKCSQCGNTATSSQAHAPIIPGTEEWRAKHHG